jgi:hypothetical protein
MNQNRAIEYSLLQNLASALHTPKILFSPCGTKNPSNKLANGSEAAKKVLKIHPRQTCRILEICDILAFGLRRGIL